MKLLLAALLAAVISFAWGFISWTVLGWHQNRMFSFRDEAAVAEVIKANATSGHGIYMLPRGGEPPNLASVEEKQKAAEAFDKAQKEGPFVFATIRPGKGEPSMTRSMILGFIRSLVAAVLAGVLLSQTTLPYAGRVAFVAAAGAFAGIVADVPGWVWFETATPDLVVSLADHLIEWTLAGTVLGALVGKEPTIMHR